MKTRASCKKRQGGAVAIIVGFSLVLLIGFLAMVIDLGHLYLAKSELQNGADAAALAGAKELIGTATGVTSAVNKAIAVAAQNDYDFTKPIDITIDDIWVGACPEDSCMVPATTVTSDGTAADKTFLKVHTRNRDLVAWFAPIWNIFKVSTYGMAVAGRYAVDITPVGICELPDDPANPHDNELGYERGVSYRVSDANPLGPGTPFWIDPTTATATGPSTCDGSVPASLPYMCAGKIAFTPIVGGYVYTNTGIEGPQLAALDSRFDEYDPQGKCDYTTAPPDSNIREYRCTNDVQSDKVCLRNTSAEIGLPREWMNTDPGRQSLQFDKTTKLPVPWATRTFTDYGVLWSASRPTVAASDATDATVSARWESLYHAGSGEATNYPQSSPYAQTGGDFHRLPQAIHPARPGRRMINMVIVECKTPGGVCRPAKVKGVGKFFLQRKANIVGDKEIYVEFTRLLQTPFSPAEIRLYR